MSLILTVNDYEGVHSLGEDLKSSKKCIEQKDKIISTLKETKFQVPNLYAQNVFFEKIIRSLADLTSNFECKILTMDNRLQVQNDRIEKMLNCLSMIKTQTGCTIPNTHDVNITFDDKFKQFTDQVSKLNAEVKSELIQLGDNLKHLCIDQPIQSTNKVLMAGSNQMLPICNDQICDAEFDNHSISDAQPRIQGDIAFLDKETALRDEALQSRHLFQACSTRDVSAQTDLGAIVEYNAGLSFYHYEIAEPLQLENAGTKSEKRELTKLMLKHLFAVKLQRYNFDKRFTEYEFAANESLSKLSTAFEISQTEAKRYKMMYEECKTRCDSLHNRATTLSSHLDAIPSSIAVATAEARVLKLKLQEQQARYESDLFTQRKNYSQLHEDLVSFVQFAEKEKQSMRKLITSQAQTIHQLSGQLRVFVCDRHKPLNADKRRESLPENNHFNASETVMNVSRHAHLELDITRPSW